MVSPRIAQALEEDYRSRDATLPASPRETVTLTELAAILDISLSTAYNLARTNELPIPTLRLGRQFRFSRRALDRYLDSDAPNERAELADAA